MKCPDRQKTVEGISLYRLQSLYYANYSFFLSIRQFDMHFEQSPPQLPVFPLSVCTTALIIRADTARSRTISKGDIDHTAFITRVTMKLIIHASTV